MASSMTGLPLILALAAGLTAGAALAEPPPAVPSGDVTVVGKRPKACGDKDQRCILAVAKEVWTLYPHQIESFCNNSIMHEQFQQTLIEEFGLSSSLDPAGATHGNDGNLNPALRSVCDFPRPALAQLPDATNWVPWSSVPSDADIAAVYPRAAKASFGDARINCEIETSGKLSHCQLSAESPERQDFGKAALRLKDKFRVNVVVAAEKRSEKIWVDIAVHFSPTRPTPRLVAGLDWTLLPDAARTAALYPADAAKAGVPSGFGKLDCQIAENGALDACRLVEEQPAALGFGAAALAVAPQLRANLWTRDGQPTAGAHVVVPLRFDAPAADAPKAPTGG